MRSDLDQARNIFGPIAPDIRQRLLQVAFCPCEEHWDDASGIILNGWTTLWQAVVAVDPTFPRTGPTSTLHGHNDISGWPRVPDRDLIIAAVRKAVHEPDAFRTEP